MRIIPSGNPRYPYRVLDTDEEGDEVTLTCLSTEDAVSLRDALLAITAQRTPQPPHAGDEKVRE